jgi:hypothetical protein
MKKVFTPIIVLIFTVASQAQSKTAEDVAIKKTITNYIENFFENNYDKMKESLHPRLAKRGFNSPGSNKLSDDFPPEKLKELMSTKQKFEVGLQSNIVENITVYGNMASACLRTGYPRTRWVEYIHLLKQEETWKIINVFWEFEKNKAYETN